ncbi:MAG: alpha/beta hydrolase [Microbacteriaceae bacterium]|nr:alpha/beta hydrolase [Microbacteriaceae bacterium]
MQDTDEPNDSAEFHPENIGVADEVIQVLGAWSANANFTVQTTSEIHETMQKQESKTIRKFCAITLLKHKQWGLEMISTIEISRKHTRKFYDEYSTVIKQRDNLVGALKQQAALMQSYKETMARSAERLGIEQQTVGTLTEVPYYMHEQITEAQKNGKTGYENYNAQAWRAAAGHYNVQVALRRQNFERMRQLKMRAAQIEDDYLNLMRGVQVPRPIQSALVTSGIDGVRKLTTIAFDQSRPELQLMRKLLTAKDGSEIALIWQRTNLSDSARERLLNTYPFEIANLPGLPLEIRAEASQIALAIALENPEYAYRRLGLTPPKMTLNDFKEKNNILYEAVVLGAFGAGGVGAKLSKTEALENLKNGKNKLIAYGRHNGKAVAQVATGDISKAKHIVMLVPGMFSDIGDAKKMLAGLGSISKHVPGDGNVYVAWMGYDSPNMFEEPSMEKARRGAQRLVDDIQMLQNAAPPASKFTVIGHSYGSTTAAEALKVLPQNVTNFITIGSAGLATGTLRGELRANKMYASTADPTKNSTGCKPATRNEREMKSRMRTKYYKNQQLASAAHDPQRYYDFSKMDCGNNPITMLKNIDDRSDIVAPIGRNFGEHLVDPRGIADAVPLDANRYDKPHFVNSHSLYEEQTEKHYKKLEYKKGYLNDDTQTVHAIAEILRKDNAGDVLEENENAKNNEHNQVKD